MAPYSLPSIIQVFLEVQGSQIVWKDFIDTFFQSRNLPHRKKGKNFSEWTKKKTPQRQCFLIAPFISCTIMKNNHKKDWKPKIIYNLFFFFLKWGPSSESLFSQPFFFFLNHRVFIHDMFYFIKHSPFFSFYKRQKNYIRTYIHIHIYIYRYL